MPARHLKLFDRDDDELTELVLGADVIHLDGGNTANMLDVWHRHGFDRLLFQALERGAVLTDSSAGGLCWFEGGTTTRRPHPSAAPRGTRHDQGQLLPAL